MQIIVGDRGVGKSREVIRQAIEHKCFIAVINVQMVRDMQNMAQILGMSHEQAMSQIITHTQLINGFSFQAYPVNQRRVIIDDADSFLQRLVSHHIVVQGVTMSASVGQTLFIPDRISPEERMNYEKTLPYIAPDINIKPGEDLHPPFEE